MRSMSSRLPSPAMAVALVSLFVALGGTGYAATQLTHSKPATGARTPPSDNAADKHLFKSLLSHAAPTLSVGHAASASRASTVNGVHVKRFRFDQHTGDATTHQILSMGGLVLRASCAASSSGPVHVTASTTVGGAEVHVDLQAAHAYALINMDGNGDLFANYTGGDSYLASDNLAAGHPMDVVDVNNTSGDSVIAHLEYSNPRGNVVSVNFMSQADAMSTHDNCLVSGVATGA